MVRTVWWWTIGKMWSETNVLPRVFGWVTMTGAVVFPLVTGVIAVGRSDSPLELALRLVLSVWMLALAIFLWPRRPLA
jgi:hypothetical protein